MTAPLISCILPTYNRRPFIAHAIAYFQRQTHDNCELVILDDGDDAVGDLVPKDSTIRYERLPNRIPLGAKLNLACEMAQGDLIAHFDDDDWYAPWRLAYQLESLEATGADICGINQLLYYDLRDGRAYEYRYPREQRIWLLGSDLVYRKDFWRTHRFADIDVGMDGLFCWSAAPDRIVALDRRDFAVHMIHGANVSPKQVSGPFWFPHEVDAITRALGADWPYYSRGEREGSDLPMLRGSGDPYLAGAREVPRKGLREPDCRARPPSSSGAQTRPQPARSVVIGVHLHAEPGRLRETLAGIQAHTSGDFDLLLLPDGPDAATRAVLAEFEQFARSATEAPLGPAACFNRLARETDAQTLVLIESGTLVSPGWLDRLLAVLDADPRHGLACPSTNRAWNELAAFPYAQSDVAGLARAAEEAGRRFGAGWKSLAPLWGVGDYCLAAKRAVVEAIGPADEGYELGPCWEMDYAAQAARAGFGVVWAQGAFVFRHPFTPRRQTEEARLFGVSRQRYQDRLCGLRRSGAKRGYADHCHGAACPHFAAPAASPEVAAAATCEAPLVTCLMPTRNRANWVPQALKYFWTQDYPNLELVIVDASAESALATLPEDPRIRRVRAPEHASIGAMRNLGCEQARGEVIIHWDDDDWYAPTRVSTQVRPILEDQADVTGLRDNWFFELDTWQFWRCTPALHARLFVLDVHGGTLAFRRALYAPYCRYPELSLAEDAYFLTQLVARGARLRRLPGADVFVYLRHGTNAWRFPCGTYLDPQGWVQENEPALLAQDRSFYAARSLAVPAPEMTTASELRVSAPALPNPDWTAAASAASSAVHAPCEARQV
ncbi:glycosyltransferase [Bradyrhizobium tropiciagri]|uniref:glycosyltransferase n=1 Tax=Bradyrhizobium tropiciagri TaxID=312253 RepID=UPI00067C59FF|nr:glycosyltransferase [Bradyrhizobium tropiciagri]